MDNNVSGDFNPDEFINSQDGTEPVFGDPIIPSYSLEAFHMPSFRDLVAIRDKENAPVDASLTADQLGQMMSQNTLAEGPKKPIVSAHDLTRYTDRNIAYSPYANMEERYAAAHTFSWGDSISKMGATLKGHALSSYLSAVSAVKGVAETGSLDKIVDSDYNNMMIDVTENIERMYPQYLTNDQSENPLSLRNWNTTAKQLFPTLGTAIAPVLDMAIGHVIISAAAGLTGNAGALIGGNATRLFKDAKNLTSMFKNLGTQISKIVAPTGRSLSQMAGGEAIKAKGKQAFKSLLFAQGEAGIHAKMTSAEYINNRVKEHTEQYGYAPNADEMTKIHEQAKNIEQTVYGMVIPIVAASNIAQFGPLLMGRNIVTKQQGIKSVVLDKLKQKAVAKGAIRKSAWESLKDAGSEGLEEYLQGASSIGATNMYDPRVNANFIGGVMSGVEGNFNQEGLMEFLGGAFAGGLMQTPGGIMSAYGARSRARNAADSFNTGIDTFSQGINNINTQADKINNRITASYSRQDLNMSQAAADIQEAAERDQVAFGVKRGMHDLTFNMAQSDRNHGTHELQKQRLAEMSNMDIEEFNNTYGTDFKNDDTGKAQRDEYVSDIIGSYERSLNAIDNIEQIYQINPFSDDKWYMELVDKFSRGKLTKNTPKKELANFLHSSMKKKMAYYASEREDVTREMQLNSRAILEKVGEDFQTGVNNVMNAPTIKEGLKNWKIATQLRLQNLKDSLKTIEKDPKVMDRVTTLERLLEEVNATDTTHEKLDTILRESMRESIDKVETLGINREFVEESNLVEIQDFILNKTSKEILDQRMNGLLTSEKKLKEFIKENAEIMTLFKERIEKQAEQEQQKTEEELASDEAEKKTDQIDKKEEDLDKSKTDKDIAEQDPIDPDSSNRSELEKQVTLLRDEFSGRKLEDLNEIDRTKLIIRVENIADIGKVEVLFTDDVINFNGEIFKNIDKLIKRIISDTKIKVAPKEVVEDGNGVKKSNATAQDDVLELEDDKVDGLGEKIDTSKVSVGKIAGEYGVTKVEPIKLNLANRLINRIKSIAFGTVKTNKTSEEKIEGTLNKKWKEGLAAMNKLVNDTRVEIKGQKRYVDGVLIPRFSQLTDYEGVDIFKVSNVLSDVGAYKIETKDNKSRVTIDDKPLIDLVKKRLSNTDDIIQRSQAEELYESINEPVPEEVKDNTKEAERVVKEVKSKFNSKNEDPTKGDYGLLNVYTKTLMGKLVDEARRDFMHNAGKLMSDPEMLARLYDKNDAKVRDKAKDELIRKVTRGFSLTNHTISTKNGEFDIIDGDENLVTKTIDGKEVKVKQMTKVKGQLLELLQKDLEEYIYRGEIPFNQNSKGGEIVLSYERPDANGKTKIVATGTPDELTTGYKYKIISDNSTGELQTRVVANPEVGLINIQDLKTKEMIVHSIDKYPFFMSKEAFGNSKTSDIRKLDNQTLFYKWAAESAGVKVGYRAGKVYFLTKRGKGQVKSDPSLIRIGQIETAFTDRKAKEKDIVTQANDKSTLITNTATNRRASFNFKDKDVDDNGNRVLRLKGMTLRQPSAKVTIESVRKARFGTTKKSKDDLLKQLEEESAREDKSYDDWTEMAKSQVSAPKDDPYRVIKANFIMKDGDIYQRFYNFTERDENGKVRGFYVQKVLDSGELEDLTYLLYGEDVEVDGTMIKSYVAEGYTTPTDAEVEFHSKKINAVTAIQRNIERKVSNRGRSTNTPKDIIKYIENNKKNKKKGKHRNKYFDTVQVGGKVFGQGTIIHSGNFAHRVQFLTTKFNQVTSKNELVVMWRTIPQEEYKDLITRTRMPDDESADKDFEFNSIEELFEERGSKNLYSKTVNKLVNELNSIENEWQIGMNRDETIVQEDNRVKPHILLRDRDDHTSIYQVTGVSPDTLINNEDGTQTLTEGFVTLAILSRTIGKRQDLVDGSGKKIKISLSEFRAQGKKKPRFTELKLKDLANPFDNYPDLNISGKAIPSKGTSGRGGNLMFRNKAAPGKIWVAKNSKNKFFLLRELGLGSDGKSPHRGSYLTFEIKKDKSTGEDIITNERLQVNNNGALYANKGKEGRRASVPSIREFREIDIALLPPGLYKDGTGELDLGEDDQFSPSDVTDALKFTKKDIKILNSKRSKGISEFIKTLTPDEYRDVLKHYGVLFEIECD